jgi:dolichyl-phosphate-mannose-protein mannosyltransferase
VLKKLSNTKELPNWTKYTNFLVLTFISTISIFYFYISAQNEIVGLVADDAVYLLMADYFSPYYSSLSQTAAFIMETSQFPPLYSISLAIFGASSENILLAHVLTTSYFFGAVIIYSFWLRIDKVNQLTSHCLSLILICAPVSFLMNIDLWSEHLYLLLTMCALFYVEKSHINNKYWLVASLLIGLMPLVRLVGVTFVIAYFVYLYLHKIKYRNRYFAISIIPFIIWKFVSIIFYSSDIYGNTLIGFYQYDFWLHTKHLFLSQLPDLWVGWHECFDIRKNLFSGVVAACVLVLSLSAWFSRLLNKRIDSLYLLFYLILILIWPDPNHNMRFTFVVFPILLYYSYLSLSFILKYDVMQNLRAIINYAVFFIISATFLPTDLYAINRSFAKMPAELESYRSTRYLLSAKYNVKTENTIKILIKTTQSYIEASQYVPEDQCVYTAHQENFMYYARRLAFTFPFPDEVKNNDIFQYLDKCKYIHVLYTTGHPDLPGGYPINRLDNKFDYLMSTQMSEDTNSQVVGSLLKLY